MIMQVELLVSYVVLGESGWRLNHPFTLQIMMNPDVLVNSAGFDAWIILGVAVSVLLLFKLQTSLVYASRLAVQRAWCFAEKSDAEGHGGSGDVKGNRVLTAAASLFLVLLLVPIPLCPPSYPRLETHHQRCLW